MFVIPGYVEYTINDGRIRVKSNLLQNEIEIDGEKEAKCFNK